MLRGPGLRPGGGDEIRERGVSGIDVGRDHVGERAERGHRCEIAHGIIGQVLEQRHADRGRGRKKSDGIAVGRRRQHRGRRGDAAGAGLVVDHDLAVEPRAELVREQPQREVGDRSGGEWRDDADRPGGKLPMVHGLILRPLILRLILGLIRVLGSGGRDQQRERRKPRPCAQARFRHRSHASLGSGELTQGVISGLARQVCLCKGLPV